MLSLAWVVIVVSVTNLTGSATLAPSPDFLGSDTFEVLANLLKPAVQNTVLDRLGQQVEDEPVPICCGYFCDADASEVHSALAKLQGLDPRQLGDMKLIHTSMVAEGHHQTYDKVAIVFIDYPADVAAPTWLNVDGTQAVLTNPGHWQGSAVVMSAGASISFSSPVKLAIVPILQRPRPIYDYYIGSGIWQALVSAHRRSGFLSLAFFRDHSKYPLYWHSFVWSVIGVLLLILLAIPFLYRPLKRLLPAIEKRLGRGKTEEAAQTEEAPRIAGDMEAARCHKHWHYINHTVKPRICSSNASLATGCRDLPRLMGRTLPPTQASQGAKLPMGAFAVDSDRQERKLFSSCPSPMTPGTQQLSFEL